MLCYEEEGPVSYEQDEPSTQQNRYFFSNKCKFLKSENVIRWPLNIVTWHINLS